MSWLIVMGNRFSSALLQAYREKEQPRLFIYAFSILHMRRDRWFIFIFFNVVFDCLNGQFWQLLGVDLNTCIVSNLQ